MLNSRQCVYYFLYLLTRKNMFDVIDVLVSPSTVHTACDHDQLAPIHHAAMSNHSKFIRFRVQYPMKDIWFNVLSDFMSNGETDITEMIRQ